jgi:hypothetical protein
MTVLATKNNIIRMEEAPFVSFDTGSFLQHDPIPAANPYSYTDNDPVNFTDPLGLIKAKCREFTRVSQTSVCFGVSCKWCWGKCAKNASSACGSAKGYESTLSKNRIIRWAEEWLGMAGCSNCHYFDKAKSCDELCSRLPNSPDCLEQCKSQSPPPSQDNKGDGKNDGEPGEDVKTAPDDKGCQVTRNEDDFSMWSVLVATDRETDRDLICILWKAFAPIDALSITSLASSITTSGIRTVADKQANQIADKALMLMRPKHGNRRWKQAGKLLDKGAKLEKIAGTAGKVGKVLGAFGTILSIYNGYQGYIQCVYRDEGLLQ